MYCTDSQKGKDRDCLVLPHSWCNPAMSNDIPCRIKNTPCVFHLFSSLSSFQGTNRSIFCRRTPSGVKDDELLAYSIRTFCQERPFPHLRSGGPCETCINRTCVTIGQKNMMSSAASEADRFPRIGCLGDAAGNSNKKQLCKRRIILQQSLFRLLCAAPRHVSTGSPADAPPATGPTQPLSRGIRSSSDDTGRILC